MAVLRPIDHRTLQQDEWRQIGGLSGLRFSNDVIGSFLSIMTTCGMYESSSDWKTKISRSSKSGVAGDSIEALPGQIG